MVWLQGNPIHVLAVGAGVAELVGAAETADDLLGALARLADGGIDVVVLSLDLPDGQGVDAVRALTERAPDVPVIALADEGRLDEALVAGATDVVPQDGGGELLTRAIRYAVSLRRLRAEIRRLKGRLAETDPDAQTPGGSAWSPPA